MPNPFAKFGISDSELAKHIRDSAEVDAGINEFMANEVVPYWKANSPVDSGEYAASVKVVKKAKKGRGVVAATAWYAHLLEFGTGGDKKVKKRKGKRRIKVDGRWVAMPDNTPTKALGVGQKVAEHFGGNLADDGGISFGGK